MSLRDAFQEIKEGKYKYYYVEKAMNSFTKEERLSIIKKNLVYLISYQKSNIVGLQYLSHTLLVEAIQEWVSLGELTTDEDYECIKRCQEFLLEWQKFEKSPTSVTMETLCGLVEKIKALISEYEIRKKTEKVKGVIEK